MTSVLLFFSVSAKARESSDQKCVRIYYDSVKSENYKIGKTYSIFLQNLMGHFPQYQSVISPIEKYQKGEINQCKATFYLGSYFENNIPQAFLDDYVSTSKNVAWLGYSLWKLGNQNLMNLFGYEYKGLTTLDWSRSDPGGRPTFFKEIKYKGEIFFKYGDFSDTERKTFSSPFEQVALKSLGASNSTEVLATSIHNGTQEQLPYVIKNKNHFYIADIPFSYIHDSDRYLIFADLLFDILEEEPIHKGKRPAIFRVEDVHACAPTNGLKAILNVVKEFNIPTQIALVPQFKNPLLESDDCKNIPQKSIFESPEVLSTLHQLKNHDATFLWHGVTHQYGNLRNPVNAASGDDFEFWDITRNAPVPEDSVSWVLDRLDSGWETLLQAGLAPKIWETPHYRASILDYHLFSRVFSWSIGIVMYAPHTLIGLPTSTPTHLWYENSGLQGSALRKEALKSTNVSVKSEDIHGQFFPYEIYGDQYGQRIIPENMGFIAPYEEKKITIQARINHLIEIAKRNRVLRDTWASFFFHPYHLDHLMSSVENAEPLKKLIQSILDYQYEFIKLETFTETRKTTLRPTPIITD